MNILFVTIAWPDKGERNLYSDLLDEFVKNGHAVYVLSNDEKTSNTCTGIENGIHVLRVRSARVKKAKKVRKALSLFAMGKHLRKELFKHWPELEIDLILSHSPPITLSALFKSLKRKYQAPFYYLLKDIWPDGPADLKIIRKNGLVYRFFRSHEIRLYKTADFIGCMSPMNVDYILSRNGFLSAKKVEVCPNTITPRSLELKESKSAIRERHNIPEAATVFIFSGNLGKAHGLDFYIDAIAGLKDYKEAYFLIGGSGQYFKFAEKEISRRGLDNIGIYSRLPAGEFDKVLHASDVGVVLLDSLYTVPQFPSRLLAYLEAQKPVFCAVNRDTDIGTIVQDANCGLSVIHGDMNSFSEAVKYFCESNKSGALDEMSLNSGALLHQRYSSSNSYEIIMNHFSG